MIDAMLDMQIFYEYIIYESTTNELNSEQIRSLFYKIMYNYVYFLTDRDQSNNIIFVSICTCTL